MHLTHLVAGLLLAATAFPTALAWKTERAVTPVYVANHAAEFSVQVTRGQDGMLNFAIRHDVRRPSYHEARLQVLQEGRLVASSDTPHFSCPEGLLFHFTLSAEAAVESRFELSDCPLVQLGDTSIPLPATVVHVFRLADFIPSAVMG